jgi:N-acetylmuramoyl-L-alanine amidase
MLKIHSFLQRVKKPLEKALPNGRSKTSLAILIYAMVTVVLLLSPDYINGKGAEETTSIAKTGQIQAANNITGETASEAVVRNDKRYLSNQFLQNELNTYSTPVTSLMPLQSNILTSTQLKLVTNEMKNTNQLISASNDSKSDKVITKANEILNSSTVETKTEETKSEVANTEQAKVNANEKVDSGSTNDKGKESTLSVSSTDKKTEDTKEKSVEKKESKKNSESDKTKTSKKEKKYDKNKNNVVGLSDKEIEILQRIVEAEASGETTKGKMLVANVILNRVKNTYFPDTVEGVVFQRNGGTYQFSPIKDGRYYSIKVSSDTKKAVNRVLKGEDESKGALYFSARSRADRSSMRWFDNHLTFLFEYGGHEFFK